MISQLLIGIYSRTRFFGFQEYFISLADISRCMPHKTLWSCLQPWNGHTIVVLLLSTSLRTLYENIKTVIGPANDPNMDTISPPYFAFLRWLCIYVAASKCWGMFAPLLLARLGHRWPLGQRRYPTRRKKSILKYFNTKRKNSLVLVFLSTPSPIPPCLFSSLRPFRNHFASSDRRASPHSCCSFAKMQSRYIVHPTHN